MQLVLIYQSQNQIIEVDSSMTINEIFLTACLTFLDTDEPADKNLGLYHRNRKITETDKTLEALQIPNHSELILANSPPRPTPETRSPQKQSQPKKQKVEDILSSAIDGLTNQTPQSASSSLPKFNFGNIKVDTSKTKESSSLKEDEIQLNKNEKREYETMFKMLQEPRMAHFRANMMQQNLKAFEALQKNSLSDFLEVYRQGKVETKLRQKKIFDVIANPDSKEAKEYLAKTKKLEAIHENFTLAMEETPEVFGSVFMLYINCKVNGRETKAFVDSGAQKTIISAKWAKHCDLDKILDDRFSGIAKGVGFQKITGRVHYATLEIEGQFLSTSFDALDGQDIDILIGLDFLKKHRANIDLRKNKLVFPDLNMETRFLSENELPASAQAKNNEATNTGEADIMQDDKFDENVRKLMEITTQDFEVCKNTLVQSGGNYDLALNNLLGQI